MTPFVTVVIATYNQAWCIHDTIESVLAQTYRHFEIVVVDDGSTDETAERVRSFGTIVTYLRHDKNHGRHTGGWAARNTGIATAQGDFIAFLDGDDLWEPEKLEAQVQAAGAHPDSGLIAVDGILFDSVGLFDDIYGNDYDLWLRIAARYNVIDQETTRSMAIPAFKQLGSHA